MIIAVNCDEISDNINKSIAFFIKNGLRHIELRSINKKNLLDYSTKEIKEFKKQLVKKKIKVIAIASPLFKWFYDNPLPSIKFDSFFFNPDITINQKKQYINKTINVAEILDTNYIRIFSNLSDGTIRPNVFWNDELLGYALEQAQKSNRYLLLENEPICSVRTKDDVKLTFKKINNPYLKLWLDIANFYQSGDQIFEEDIQDLKNVIKYIHLKDIIKNPFKYVPLGEGEINYKRILTDINNNTKDDIVYSIETHVKEDKINATSKSICNLKKYLFQKRIKYAIIGAGRISEKHKNAIKENANSELRGVFDIIKSKTKNFSKENDVKAYKVFTEALNDKSVNVINICTPHDTHIKIAEQAMASNKKVLCEKPFALSSKNLLKVLHNKKIKKNVFVVMQNNFNPAVKFLFELIKNKKLGQINYFSVNLRWWRDKKYFSDWHGSKKRSGGSLFNQAIHSFGVINRILKLNPIRIITYTNKTKNKSRVEDILVSLVKLEKGQLGSIEVYLRSRFNNVESSIFLSGTKGTIKIGGIALDKITHLDLNENIYTPSIKETHHPYGLGHSELIRVLSDYLLGINSPENKLLVRVNELKNIISFIEALYSNIDN